MISRIELIKKIDAAMGPGLLGLLPKASPVKKRGLKAGKILVIRPGGLGDALLLLPALKSVSRHLPGLCIDMLCEPRNQAVFSHAPYISRIFSYQNPADLVRLAARHYELIIDAEQSHYLSAVLARFLRADRRTGFKVNNRERVYSGSIPYAHDRYEAGLFWELVHASLGLALDFCWDFPYVMNPPALPRGLPDQHFICLFPGATIIERHWPERRWARVAKILADRGWTGILLGADKEIQQCRAIEAGAGPDRVINLCGRLTIGQTAELLKKAALLISTDSGLLHLGVISNAPTLSLFGSGIADKWAPQGDRHRQINLNLDCSPCTRFGSTPPCPRQAACMEGITVEQVVHEAGQMLDHSQAPIEPV